MVNIHAAGTIPRTDLRLELMLATGSQDTSGNGRIISSTGITPVYETDSLYGIPGMKFVGSGGLRVNTGWTGNGGDFTVSFWIKHSTNFITPVTSVIGAIQDVKMMTTYQPQGIVTTAEHYYDTYYSNLVQDIFTSDSSSGMKFIINSLGKCSLRGGSGTVQVDNIALPRETNAMGVSIPVYKRNYVIFDYGNNIQESFNCSTLLDNKWHHVILASQSGSTSIYIDTLEVAKLTGRTSIGKVLSLGSSDTDVMSFLGKGMSTGQIDTIVNSKFLRGNLSAFRIYSRLLSSSEVDSLYEEYRYAQSTLSGAGDISVAMDSYTKPVLYVKFGDISTSLSKDNVTYEYSTDGINFSPISNILDISTSTGSLKYKIGVDLTGKTDGIVSVIFRVRTNDNLFQNIGTITFSKSDLTPTIVINMPSADVLESSKTISALATGATLYQFITSTTTCDNTVSTGSFEDYYRLIFTNTSDNGKRVCYKAYYPTLNKTIYKISGMIQGIQTTDIITKTPTTSLFSNYAFWTKSAYQKLSDATNFIFELLNSPQKNNNYNQGGVLEGYTTSPGNVLTMTDINGDGLVDFLYSLNDPIRRAIVVNNGNFTFKTVYKCAIDPIRDVYGNLISYTYYGDCADPTR